MIYKCNDASKSGGVVMYVNKSYSVHNAEIACNNADAILVKLEVNNQPYHILV
jgi:hypothetical protein